MFDSRIFFLGLHLRQDTTLQNLYSLIFRVHGSYLVFVDVCDERSCIYPTLRSHGGSPVAHEAPKNVLIAEHYTHEEWEKSYAFYEGLTEIGWFIGLFFGLVAFASSLSFGALATYTLYLCGALNVVAFGLSVFLILAHLLMIFERRLVGMERKLDYTFRGLEASSRMMDGLPSDRKFKRKVFQFRVRLSSLFAGFKPFLHAITDLFFRTSACVTYEYDFRCLHVEFLRFHCGLFDYWQKSGFY